MQTKQSQIVHKKYLYMINLLTLYKKSATNGRKYPTWMTSSSDRLDWKFKADV